MAVANIEGPSLNIITGPIAVAASAIPAMAVHRGGGFRLATEIRPQNNNKFAYHAKLPPDPNGAKKPAIKTI